MITESQPDEAHDAELTALTTELRDTGLLTIGTDAQGRVTYTLTSEGAPGRMPDGHERA